MNTMGSETVQAAKFKVDLVGDRGVGRTSLLYTFCKGEFTEDTLDNEGRQNRISTEVDIKEFVHEGNEVMLELRNPTWNLDGKRRSRDLASDDDPDAVLVVFDVTNPHTYSSVEKKWCPEVRRRYGDKKVVVLVGTKTDLREEHEGRATLSPTRVQVITSQQGLALANRINASNYFECSCKLKQGLDDAFHEVVDAVQKADPGNHPARKRKIVPCCLPCAIL